jgi:hypothetical protein
VSDRDWDAETWDADEEDSWGPVFKKATPEEGASAPPYTSPSPPEQLPTNVVVVGSFGFENRLAVYHELGSWAEGHEGPVVLITSGCPNGAEEFARTYADARRWQVAQLRDESMLSLASAVTFAFIEGESDVVRIADALAEKFWQRRVTSTTLRRTSPWATR